MHPIDYEQLFATGQFIIIYVALRSGLGKKLVDVSDLSLLGDVQPQTATSTPHANISSVGIF